MDDFVQTISTRPRRKKQNKRQTKTATALICERTAVAVKLHAAVSTGGVGTDKIVTGIL